MAYLVNSIDSLYGREINVVLLDNARIQRVEIHDQDILVPKATLWLKHQTTFVLVLFAFLSFVV